MNILGRLKALECVNPYPVTVGYYAGFKNPRAIEKEAHKRLGDKRHNREWFNIEKAEAIQIIEAIAAEFNDPPQLKDIEKSPHGDGTGWSFPKTYEKYIN